jgi:hypothetical protein
VSKDRPPGGNSEGPEDTTPAGSESSAMVDDGADTTEDLDATGLLDCGEQ